MISLFTTGESKCQDLKRGCHLGIKREVGWGMPTCSISDFFRILPLEKGQYSTPPFGHHFPVVRQPSEAGRDFIEPIFSVIREGKPGSEAHP